MPRLALALCTVLLAAAPALAQPAFIEFESGPVRPVALSPDRTRLFVTNIPDNRLEVFNVGLGGTLTHAFSVPVGMEPVAVAPRSNTEVWVVNHLSDSVSVVDLSTVPPRVARTLLVGDEPRDIVFAGTGGNRAFISTAHRGQQRTDPSLTSPPLPATPVPGAGDPQLTTAGVDRADVWVFDATDLGSTVGGTPVRILTFLSDTPRALATDGTTVYLAAFHSGNQSTVILETVVPNGFATSCSGGPGTAGNGVPGPADNAAHAAAPETGVIVKRVGSNWVDSIGCTWNAQVPFTLPDHDVFRFDANTFASAGADFDHVGTILFNMVVNTNTGKVYVTNTESPNLTRFEGSGLYGGSTVQGHLSESRITVLNPSGSPAVTPQHLNKHINYALLHTTPGADHAAINAQAQHSLATPLQPVLSSNGAKLYVPAFGSAKIGVFDTTTLENGSFNPALDSANYIATSGGGPAGLALDEPNDRLYVLTRFDNRVHAINLTSKATVQSLALHNPEPPNVITGRQFLYDAQVSSANGEASCASCHIFGDFDSLAWNLGDPDGAVTPNSQPSASPNLPKINNFPVAGANWTTFHPMKGPMTTQTLRGMATHGGMHWRGDRVSGLVGNDPCNNSSPSNSPCDESLSFRNFIVAFEGLVGKQGTITTTQMQQFTDFILQVFLPPNPVRALDNSLTASASAVAGEAVYFACPNAQCQPNGAGTSDNIEDCDGCHELKPILGFFGTAGQQTFEGEPQNAKVPHLRNAYQKVGMFGVAGNQVRGTGYLHDGAIPTLKNFFEAPAFPNLTDQQELDLEQFMLRFPTDLAPVVGQQVTLTATNSAVAGPRIDLLIQRANASFQSFMLGGTVTECDLIAKGTLGVKPAGWVKQGAQFRDDAHALSDPAGLWTDVQLRALVTTDGPLTYTCAPPGSGVRMGIDRDLDGTPDGLPEPGTAVSLAAGAALLAVLARRRSRLS